MRAQLLTNETLLGVIRCCPPAPPLQQQQQQQTATRKSLNHRHWLNICVLFLVLSGVWLLFCFCPALLLFFRACVFHWQRSGDARPPFASSGLSTYFRPYWDAFSVGRSVCFFFPRSNSLWCCWFDAFLFGPHIWTWPDLSVHWPLALSKCSLSLSLSLCKTESIWNSTGQDSWTPLIAGRHRRTRPLRPGPAPSSQPRS